MLAAGIPFPRGGKPRMKNKVEQFALDDHDGMKTDRGNKKSHKKKKLTKQSEISTRETPDVLIENLTMQSISPGMVLLGCVFEIQDYCLKLSLPGRLFGTVPITNISNKYTSLLKGFAENPDDEEVSTLQAIFHIGQTLPCKVMSTKSSESSKNHITLSVNPHDVNEALQLASLLHGMVLYCAVQSVEDHGYVMDIGIKDVPGFLSHSLAAQYIKAYNDGQSLAVGHLVPTVVNMPSLKKGKLRFGQAVTLTAEPTVVMKSKLNELSDIALDTFIPGTPVDAVIQKVTECGLVVDCLGFSGCIYKDHMKNKTGAVYKQGQSFQGTVLYSNPVTHVLHLTMHTIPSPKKIKKMFGGLKKWQVIDEAVVTAVHKSNVCLKLKDNVQGIAVKNELSDQPIENISKKFSIDDIVRCRIISLHYLDNIVAVSLKASTLGQTYVSHDDLTVGEMYEGKVKKFVPGGMVVVLSPGIQGFVRDIHMADVPLTKPEVMFPKGKKVKCKILSIDRSSSPPAISLTCKKGMLMTKVPILASYEEASAGVTTKGVIVNIRDNGLVLSFLNEVQGWVPSSEFGAYKILHPEKVFFKGQVVKCRVMNCYPEDKKLFLTLRIDSTKLFGDTEKKGEDFLPAMQELESWATPVKSFPCLQVAKGYNFTVQNVSDLKRPAENSDDESDKEEEKRKKPRNADKSDNEKLVFKTENLLVDGNRTVQTAEDFEEVLKQFPNSAGHWLNYIGFYLEQMEVDKARNVAERALKTISFREEQERLNVWIVYLNLENLFGSQESMHNVLERALQQNEPLKIYSVVVHIYLNSNKIEEAESLYQTMVKKFHLNKDVWIDFGLFYMKTGRPELARQVMDRGLKSIDQKFHVDLISKFAQLELKYGDSDLGKTMFDNILKNYSKRTDLWSVYIDLLIKLKQFDAVRNLFEELITKKMSLRKTKFFFKRYVTFERNYGTEETVNTVIKKAEECLKSDIEL